MSKQKKKHNKKNSEEIENLEKALKEAESKAEKYLNQLKYARADLDNIQKQNQRRINEIMNRANGRILEQLLPIIDELHLFINQKNTDTKKLKEGVNMTLNKLTKILESEGVQPILAEGYKFDPNKHEAMMEVETIEEPDGYVIEEVRKGYMYKERVLRASMVKVARKPDNKNEEK